MPRLQAPVLARDTTAPVRRPGRPHAPRRLGRGARLVQGRAPDVVGSHGARVTTLDTVGP